MTTRVKLKPGQNGTKKHVTQYGDALVCVRYRYDAIKHKQYKTVEIIVSESEWTPPPAKYPDGALVPLKIGINETILQGQVRAVGGRWDKQQQVWFVPYGCIVGTKQEKLIAIENFAEGKMNIKSTIDTSIIYLIMAASLAFIVLMFKGTIKPSTPYARILFSGATVLLAVRALVTGEISVRDCTVQKSNNPVGYWCGC